MNEVSTRFQRLGYVVLDTGATDSRDIQEVESALSQIGTLFRVFLRFPKWKPLTSDLSRPTGKSSGVGENSLHIDCVNMENPPPVVALHCLRADPLRGGQSRLAPSGVVMQQSDEVLRVLSQPLFDEGVAYDLQNVGQCLPNFPIVPTHPGGWVRWTGRLRDKPQAAHVRTSLATTEDALRAATQRIALKAGQTLVVDQRRFLHGRDGLGPDQQSIPEHQRRLLVQCYVDPSRRLEGD